MLWGEGGRGMGGGDVHCWNVEMHYDVVNATLGEGSERICCFSSSL